MIRRRTAISRATTSRSRAAIRTTAGALALALLTALAGCGSSGHQVLDRAPERKAYPVVAPGQANSVLGAVEGALVRGVTATETSAGVDARLLGPLRELELAQARVAAQQKTAMAKPAQVKRLRLIVPTSSTWPRFFIAVGSSNASSTPVLRVLSSASAREPYGLWAEATMMPGATLPQTAAESTGSPMVALDDPGLVIAPKEVLAGFAGYLNKEARTTASRQFRRSVYTDQLLQRLAADRKGLKSVARVSSHHAVAAGEPLAVRTSDGGALVIGELLQTYVVTIKKGKGKVQVRDKELAALAGGKKQFSTSFTRTAIEVLVFHVPARGKGLITVVAAQKGDIKAVAK